MSSSLNELKQKLASQLVTSKDLAQSKASGLPTGLLPLDRFLPWQGLPKGDLTLFYGSLGLGSTSLWSQAALSVMGQKKWTVWVNAPGVQLCPWNLQQKGCDFSKLLVVTAPNCIRKCLWVLQELMSSSLFDLIGCDLGAKALSDSQMMKLKKVARSHESVVVLLSSNARLRKNPLFPLILNFQNEQITIERARHRPTPHLITRRNTYADIMPQLAKNRKALCS